MAPEVAPQPKPVPEPAAEPAAADPSPAPEPVEAAAAPPPTEARRGRLKADLKTRPKCPECGASMMEGAVVCMHCGFDQRAPLEPEVEKAPVSRRTLPIRPIAIAAGLVLVGAVFGAFHLLSGSGEDPDAPVSAGADPFQPEIDDPFEEEDPDWLTGTDPEADPTPVADAAEPLPPPDTSPVEQEPAPTTTAAQPDSEMDPAADVEARLAEEFPVLQIDEMAAIRLEDGTGLRGRIVNIHPRRVGIRVGGVVRDISLDRLDHASRMRIDPLYRTVIANQLKQEAAQRRSESSTETEPPSPGN